MKLKNYTNNLKKNNIIIINNWLSNSKITQILEEHSINKKLFQEKYAINILNYYIHIIEEQNCIDSLSIIKPSLDYIKKLNISSSHLFVLCVTLKNTITGFICTNNKNLIFLEKELNNIFEEVFECLLEYYSSSFNYTKKALIKSDDVFDKNIVMSKTDDKGKITEVSSAFCKLSGYHESELVGKPHNIIRYPDVSADVFKQLWKTIKSGNVWSGQLKNRKKNGDCYWVQTSIHPNFDKMGQIISYDAVVEDITSKKKLENQQNILISQSKSAAMGEMISMITHQWKQPLQAVSILIQKLPIVKMVEGDISDDLLDDVINDVRLQLEYMSNTIDDFRDYFKPNREKESVLIDSIINKAVDFLNHMIKIDSLKININTEISCKTTVHFNEIVQVLINLIKNSRDAMIENEIVERIINISTSFNEKNVYIVIEDSAGGIKDDVLDKIFEPYFSTKLNKNGTGLGLYMSKIIIEEHNGGKLLVHNSDIGANFTISLPLE